MTEPENLDPGNYDSEAFNEGFETAYDIASQETQEQMAELLEDAGFDDDEIEEALYDPAPRRGRRRSKRRSRRHSARSYDPAPARRRRRGGRKGSKRKGGRKGKGKLAKFRKFAMPAATAASFYFSYAETAKARGLNIIDALKADLANWSAQKTMDKISANPLPIVGAVGIPFVRGYVPGANSGIMAVAVDVIHGILTGQALTQIVDEPGPVRSISARPGTAVTPGNAITQAPAQPAYHNPYGGY